VDRPEGTRYAGLVAGYYGLDKLRVVRSFPIPVSKSEQGSVLVQKPAKLSIVLGLGPDRITSPAVSSNHQP